MAAERRMFSAPTSSPKAATYSKSNSYNVSIWSEVKAIGTNNIFFFPFLTRPFIASSVCGPNHGKGPTFDCHTKR